MDKYVVSILLVLILVLMNMVLFLFWSQRRKKAKQIMKEIDIMKMISFYNQAKLELSALEAIYGEDNCQEARIEFNSIEPGILEEIKGFIALCQKTIFPSKEIIEELEETRELYYSIISILKKIIDFSKRIEELKNSVELNDVEIGLIKEQLEREIKNQPKSVSEENKALFSSWKGKFEEIQNRYNKKKDKEIIWIIYDMELKMVFTGFKETQEKIWKDIKTEKEASKAMQEEKYNEFIAALR